MKQQSKNHLSKQKTSSNLDKDNPDLDNELFAAMQGWVSDEHQSDGNQLGFVENYDEEYECVLQGGSTPDYI